MAEISQETPPDRTPPTSRLTVTTCGNDVVVS